jgi:hypothetical protein
MAILLILYLRRIAGSCDRISHTVNQRLIRTIQVFQCGYPLNHVLAGDILAPGNTRNVEEIILDFVSKIQ